MQCSESVQACICTVILKYNLGAHSERHSLRLSGSGFHLGRPLGELFEENDREVSLTSATWRAQKDQENDSRWLQGCHCQKGSDLFMSQSSRELDFSCGSGRGYNS